MEIPTLEELKASDGMCFQKAKADDQLSFTVIEQDMTAPLVIVDWIKYNLKNCRPEKLHSALARAIAMAKSPKRKHAD